MAASLGNMPNESVLNQADSVLKMLDELSEADPEGYKKFIDQKMKEGMEYYSPPEPCFCISTLMLPEVIPHMLFVNVCGWERIPAPQSDQHPIPVMVGEIQTEGMPQFSVIDAIISPVALKGAENNKDHKNLLVHVALDYIEHVKSIRVSKKYKNLKIKYKGDPKQLRRFLRPPVTSSPGASNTNTAGSPTPSVPKSLLQQLAAITMKDSTVDVKDPSSSLFERINTEKPSKAGLVQEISSTPHVEVPQVPKHEMFIRDADGSKPRRILIKVDLPGVSSAARCQLHVSEQDVLLVVGPQKYQLHVQLPEKVDEERSGASLNTLNHKLFIKLPTKL